MKIKANEKHFYYQESARSGQLTLEEYAIYCYLLQYVDKDAGVAYPSVEMIYTDLNTTKKRVRKNLDSLREKGFIEWESGNSHKSNTYFFPKHYSDMKDKTTPVGSSDENSIGTKLTPITGTKLTPPKENIKENIKENNNGVAIAPPSNANAKNQSNQELIIKLLKFIDYSINDKVIEQINNQLFNINDRYTELVIEEINNIHQYEYVLNKEINQRKNYLINSIKKEIKLKLEQKEKERKEKELANQITLIINVNDQEYNFTNEDIENFNIFKTNYLEDGECEVFNVWHDYTTHQTDYYQETVNGVNKAIKF